ncbi:hypothetical protein EYZ11_007633 [Aspergillus tanneri]|uniref:Uncharacterized protein n=1 Tax=Aspergillus tanneri TaxID=1220188 RepID=A0A4S3JI43_9EURO|nr:hypothetical protein EYZ11_007633 [Aspergillus tanneri]
MAPGRTDPDVAPLFAPGSIPERGVST